MIRSPRKGTGKEEMIGSVKELAEEMIEEIRGMKEEIKKMASGQREMIRLEVKKMREELKEREEKWIREREEMRGKFEKMEKKLERLEVGMRVGNNERRGIECKEEGRERRDDEVEGWKERIKKLERSWEEKEKGNRKRNIN